MWRVCGALRGDLAVIFDCRAPAVVRSKPPRRVLRIWGHWAHLMTTAHRGRSSDGGFVEQFLWLRKSVSCRSVRHCFLGLFTFLVTLRLAGHYYTSERRLNGSLTVQALQTKSRLATEPGRFRHCFLALFTFLGTVRLGGPKYYSLSRLGCTLVFQALQKKSTS